MVKRPNVIVKGQDGKIVIIDCDGNIQCLDHEKLGSKIATLMAQRQAAGIAISKALAKAGYSVCSQQESFVMETVAPAKKPGRKK